VGDVGDICRLASRLDRSQPSLRERPLCDRAATGPQNLWLVSISSFSIKFIPSPVPSPRHDRQRELNDYSDGDAHQRVYNTLKRCTHSHSRPRATKPSTTPIGEQHHPMEPVRRGSSTRGMRTIHVCFLHSTSSNHHANPLLIPIAFHSTMQIPLLEPPRSP